jgi:hypothetical protein
MNGSYEKFMNLLVTWDFGNFVSYKVTAGSAEELFGYIEVVTVSLWPGKAEK